MMTMMTMTSFQGEQASAHPPQPVAAATIAATTMAASYHKSTFSSRLAATTEEIIFNHETGVNNSNNNIDNDNNYTVDNDHNNHVFNGVFGFQAPPCSKHVHGYNEISNVQRSNTNFIPDPAPENIEDILDEIHSTIKNLPSTTAHPPGHIKSLYSEKLWKESLPQISK
eukprot:m.172026 g.172026  ORF g.172026 m.172026 type:complete len:169 (-) comp16510_c1_seq4:89-595(-)